MRASFAAVTASIAIAIASLSLALSLLQHDITQMVGGLLLSLLILSSAAEHLLGIAPKVASARVRLGLTALAFCLTLGPVGNGTCQAIAIGIVILYLALALIGLLKSMGVSTSRATLSLISASTTLLLAVAVLALFDRGATSQGYVTHYLKGFVQPDPDLGYIQTPHSIFRTYYPDNPEGAFVRADANLKDDPQGIPSDAPYYVEYRNNAEGYREKDYSQPCPPGVCRIVLLGDSLTQGIGVPEEQTFARRLEAKLSSSVPFTPCEVINTGMRGLSTREERFHLQKRAISYEPQVVILVMYTNDDLFITREVEHAQSLPRWRWTMALFRPEFGRNMTQCAIEAREIKKLCDDRGAKLAIVLFRYETTNGLWDDLRRNLADHLPEVPLHDVGDDILAKANGRNLLVHPIDPHPNGLAHSIAAESILTFLRKENLVPSDDKTQTARDSH